MLGLPGAAALLGAGLLMWAAGGGSAGSEVQAAGVLVLRTGAGGSVSAEEGAEGVAVLRAEADEGHFFSAWRCIEGLLCPEGAEGRRMAFLEIAAEGAAGLAAEFEAEPVSATLTILQAAGGAVTSSCGAVCTRREGSAVDVQAVPDAGYRFGGWDCRGGGACRGIDLFDPSPRLLLSGSVTLTPVYVAAAGGGDAAVRSVEGGSWRLAAECGAGCAAGGGWTALASAVAGGSHVFRGWGCAEGVAACPLGAQQLGSADLRLEFGGRLALAPEFSRFRLFSPDQIDFASISRRVEEQAICNVLDECLYTTSGGSTRLIVDTRDAGLREYEWSLTPEHRHVSLGNQVDNRIDLIADGGLDEIVELVVEVSSRGTGGVAVRDTLMVVVVPAGLAVNVNDSCSGFVAARGSQHFVVTAAHCLTEFNEVTGGFEVEEELEVEIGPSMGGVRLTGEAAGLDELTDVGVIRIPDPGLGWLPRVHPTAPVPGRPLRVVGYPRTADFVGDETPQLTVTAGMSMDYGLRCEQIYPFALGLNAGGLPSTCDAQYIFVVPDPSSVRGSGGPVLNADGRVVGLVSSGSISDGGEQVTRAAVIGEQLERLFRGGRRCLDEFVVEEKTFGSVTFDALVQTVFDDCRVE